jgi:oligopeptide transport system substrate-binding protein
MLRPIVLAASCALLLASCQRETEVDRANREKILLVGNSVDPKALDPHLVTGVIESNVIRALIEGLVAGDPKEDLGFPPGAATHWEHNETFTEWTFHLRPGGLWSDGEPLTAEDFVFSYNRLLHPDLAGPYADMLYFLENAETYNRNQRGRILVDAGLVPGATWEAVSAVNFGGDGRVSIDHLGNSPKFSELSDEERGRYVRHHGLDALERDYLIWILSEPASRFTWPEGMDPSLREGLLKALADHAGDSSAEHPKEAVDLFTLAKVGVSAPDKLTVKVKLREPVPFLPDITRHYTWYPVPKHVVLRYGKISDRYTAWSEPGNMVGNGPFVLTEWRFNDKIEAVKNQNYWNAANVKLNGIRFIPVENFYSESRGFLAGQLHTTYQLPQPLVDKMKAEHPQFLRQEPYMGADFVRLNTTRKALDDVRVRMALSLAIDRQQLCDNLLQGSKPAGTLTPNIGEYHPDPVVSYDPVKAKALLAEAGYPDGKGFPRYAVLISSSGTRALPEALQAMWRQTLGIVVDIQAMDFPSYVTAQQTLNYDMAIAAWIGDYLDPSTFLLMWSEGNGNNNTGWHSSEYDKLLREAAQQTDPTARLDVFKKAERLMMEAQPIIPFSHRVRNYLLRPEVKGWHPLLLDNHPWGALSLEP